MLLPKVLCVTLNASIDKTYYLDSCRLGGVNRPSMTSSQAGGKGNNVARALHRLGVEVLATGLLAGHNGKRIEQSLETEGIPNSFYSLPEGESRTCLAIIDETSGDVTEVLEKGPTIPVKELNNFTENLTELVTNDMFVVFSGSLPQGMSDQDFRKLLRVVKSEGAKVIVDSSGDALKAASHENVFSVLPNRDEFDELLQPTVFSDSEDTRQMNGLSDLYNRGIETPVLTLGDEGVIVFDGRHYYKAVAPAVSVVNPVGSGDSFLAGFLYGLVHQEPLERAVAFAVAAGTANAEVNLAGMVNKDRVVELSNHVHIKCVYANRRSYGEQV